MQTLLEKKSNRGARGCRFSPNLTTVSREFKCFNGRAPFGGASSSPDSTAIACSHRCSLANLCLQHLTSKALVPCKTKVNALWCRKTKALWGDFFSSTFSIYERSIEVGERLVSGHREGDLIKGARNQSQIGTLVERTSLYTVLAQRDSSTTAHAVERFGFFLNCLDASLGLSMTNDSGKEMAHQQALTQSPGIKVFFAHAYSPWERGTNENTNGVLRRYVLEGTHPDICTHKKLDAIAFHRSAKPCNTLGRQSLAGLFLPKGSFDFQAYWSPIINPIALGA